VAHKKDRRSTAGSDDCAIPEMVPHPTGTRYRTGSSFRTGRGRLRIQLGESASPVSLPRSFEPGDKGTGGVQKTPPLAVSMADRWKMISANPAQTRLGLRLSYKPEEGRNLKLC
jgi:hypothetical protein